MQWAALPGPQLPEMQVWVGKGLFTRLMWPRHCQDQSLANMIETRQSGNRHLCPPPFLLLGLRPHRGFIPLGVQMLTSSLRMLSFLPSWILRVLKLELLAEEVLPIKTTKEESVRGILQL